MMPLVSPMNDVEFEDGGENNGNNYFPPEGREETSPLVDLGGDGKNMIYQFTYIYIIII